MKQSALPDTIQTIIDQAGGFRLHGAFPYVGASRFTYRCAKPHGEYRSSHVSKLISEAGLGFVDYEVGLQCRVNGKRRHRWTLIIAYEPNDTYSVWLVEGHPGRKPATMVLACGRAVYCDMLQTVIETVYDRAIEEHSQSFIPLS